MAAAGVQQPAQTDQNFDYMFKVCCVCAVRALFALGILSAMP